MFKLRVGLAWRPAMGWFAASTALGLLLAAQQAVDGPRPATASGFAYLAGFFLIQTYTTGATAFGAWEIAGSIRGADCSNWVKAGRHAIALGFFSIASVLLAASVVYVTYSAVREQTTFLDFTRVTTERSVSLMGLLYGLVVLAESRAAAIAAAQKRATENAELRGRLSEAHLQALRLQLQPHFLFNTLHAASALIDSRPSSARRILTDLGDLLRASLDRGSEPEVALRRELDLLQRYLDIQRIRFGDRLAFRVEAPSECLDLAVPVMMLQPLVENAIRHGLADRPGVGEVRVTAETRGSVLKILVADDGVGLTAGGLREGVGLGNTRARLERLYGSASGLEIEPGGQRGVRVSIHLPARAWPAQGPGTLRTLGSPLASYS